MMNLFEKLKNKIDSDRIFKRRVIIGGGIAAVLGIVLVVGSIPMSVKEQQAVYEQGRAYLEGRGVPRDVSKALGLFRKAAKQGLAVAQNDLGRMYANGRGVAQDNREAVEWYRKAAEQGIVTAQYNLGVHYEKGLGVAQDNREAAEWYRKAAEQGLAIAQHNLGIRYASGRGVIKSESLAVEWYRKAAEQGYPQAQYNLGVMYAKGQGVAKDEGQAVQWYRKASAQGNEDAEKSLAHVEERLRLEKEAERGDAEAQYKLGEIYSTSNRGVEKDYATAMAWFTKAAEQGHAAAQHKLGVMYSDGDGVKRDDAKAMEWYRKAADQGNEDAKKKLAAAEERLRREAHKAAEKQKALIIEAARFNWLNAYPQNQGYPSIGDAFNRYFDRPQWEAQEYYGNWSLIFTGIGRVNNARAKISVHFLVHYSTEEELKVGAVSLQTTNLFVNGLQRNGLYRDLLASIYLN